LENVIEKQVLSRKEAAAYLGIHLNTLDRSDVPRLQIGRRVLYRIKTLDKLLNDREQSGNKGRSD
jgi:hypothetical protein